MTTLYYTEQFRRDYRQLTRTEQEAIKKALSRMMSDLRYPGLRVKKIQGRDNVWEARANRDLRITFTFDATETLVLRTCGHHDDALRG